MGREECLDGDEKRGVPGARCWGMKKRKKKRKGVESEWERQD